METTTFTGTVLGLTPSEGVSASTGKPWQVLEVHVEDNDGRYPTDVVASLFGADRIAQYPLNIGDRVCLYLDLHTKQGQTGRRYNSIGIWKLEILKPAMPQPSYAPPRPPAPQPGAAYQTQPPAPSWTTNQQHKQPMPQPSYAPPRPPAPQSGTAYPGVPPSQNTNPISNPQYVPGGTFDDGPF